MELPKTSVWAGGNFLKCPHQVTDSNALKCPNFERQYAVESGNFKSCG
jgi:hypothetical protein